MYKRILLPVDGSHHSKLAVEHAIHLARPESVIILLTVLPELPRLFGGDARLEVEREVRTEAEELFVPMRERLAAAGIKVEERVLFADHPGNGIVAATRDSGADVVVMGSRGNSELENLALGSVTHRVLHLTKVPVLVVNEDFE